MHDQINEATDDLLKHELILLKDIKSTDELFNKKIRFHHKIGLCIRASKAKLSYLDAKTIRIKDAEDTLAPKNKSFMLAQELRDMSSGCVGLERRVYDLKLTRQVTVQALLTIRLVKNDKLLITNINSTLINTDPVWEAPLAEAVTIQRSAGTDMAMRKPNDLMNELLISNGANVHYDNNMFRTEIERDKFASRRTIMPMPT